MDKVWNKETSIREAADTFSVPKNFFWRQNKIVRGNGENEINMLKKSKIINQKEGNRSEKETPCKVMTHSKIQTQKNLVEESCSSAERWHQQNQVQQRESSFHKFSTMTVSCGGWAYENCVDTEENMLYYKYDSCKRR